MSGDEQKPLDERWSYEVDDLMDPLLNVYRIVTQSAKAREAKRNRDVTERFGHGRGARTDYIATVYDVVVARAMCQAQDVALGLVLPKVMNGTYWLRYGVFEGDQVSAEARALHLVWDGTDWIDDRCGCRYHPDDPNGSHGGAPHVHRCERHTGDDRLRARIEELRHELLHAAHLLSHVPGETAANFTRSATELAMKDPHI